MPHDAAIASLVALLAAIALSMTTGLNVGLVAIASAWLIGSWLAGLSAEAIMRGFPSGLFLTLTGIGLLFALAEANGTLERLAHRAAGLARGDARWMPPIFFAVACLVSAVGPGSIASVVLVAPLAMAIGGRAGVPPFLTALVVTNGANAGNLSPISAVGVIANTKMAEAGIGGHEGVVFAANFAASALVAGAAYVALGGHRVRGRADGAPEADAAMTAAHRATLLVLAAWVGGVLLLRLHPGLSAFAAAIVLVVLRLAREREAMARVPWGVIVMVCGVSVLIALLEATGGMALFEALLARLATRETVNGAMAFVTGVISLYSSTSGVVLPAFLPTVPGVLERLGGGDPLALALSINVGSALVDVSPLSTLGALCVAAVPDAEGAAALFRRLMMWGVSMTLAGALLAQLFAGVIAGAAR